MGKLAADSTAAPGWQGTTMPASLGAAVGALDDAARVARPQPGILLIDDDAFMLGIVSRMLSSMGYARVETADSAEAALRMLNAGDVPIDVILCDLNMPRMDGIEFLQLLGATPYRGSVILLSGEGARIMHTVQRLLTGSSLAVLGAIEKPAGRAALGAMLDRWKPLSSQPLAAVRQVYTGEDVLRAQQQAQWVLQYQPKVDLKDGALVGVEALVRWNHPLHGLVGPDSFIGVAEDCGAIDALTRWVLRTAMQQLATWHGSGLSIHMAVNVSMENLRVPDFAREVGALARAAALSPRDLTLEITESRLIAPCSAPLEGLVRLRMQGFGLSIDDFGTGHSSLAQLRDAPFTELKIDRGFVHGARHDQMIRPILEGSTGIARGLGLRTVAEGVETEEDWQLLRELGCDEAQGWFIGRPMFAELIPAWLERWNGRRAALVAA